MTREKLDRAEKLAGKATPGPWTAGRTDMQSYDGVTGEPFGSVYWEDPDAAWHFGNRLPGVVARTRDPERNHEDAAFIAACRELVPELVAEVRRLKHGLAVSLESYSMAVWERDSACTESWLQRQREALAQVKGFTSWAEVEEWAK